MSNSTASQTGTPEPGPTQAPPAEHFWQRYSPHKEFPLSTATSIVLHGLLLAVVVLLVSKLWVDPQRSDPLALGAIDVGNGGNAGDGDRPGAAVPPNSHQEAAADEHHPAVNPTPAVKDASLPTTTPRQPAIKVPEGADQRVIADETDDVVTRFLERANPAKRDRIKPGVSRPGPGGPGGPGTPGGRIKTVHDSRMLRWTMGFSTADGDDYRAQLMALGAILAVPEPSAEHKHTYRVYHDLEHTPVKGKVEDLNKLDRIFWVDEKSESVERLARSLGIKPPRLIAAFFPKELEQKLLAMERKKSGGRPEDDIVETIFQVEQRGGSYEPVVKSVRLKEEP